MKKSLHSLTRKCVLLTAILLTSHFLTYSQYSGGTYVDAGITIGPMVFMGDLGGHFGTGTTFLKDYNVPTTKLSVGAYATVYPNEWLGFRIAFNYGHIEGDDALIVGKGGDEESRLARNLNFRSQILEGLVGAEFYPTVFFEDDPLDVERKLRPYGMIGVGVFHFNPEGSYTNPTTHNTEWVSLPSLHTEGEGFPEYPDRKNYSLTQMNIPMAIGVKYFFNDKVNLSFEILYRKTFTDYIDDVSTKFVDPSLFYAHLPASLAPIADAMSNKSPLRSQGRAYDPGNKRGDPQQMDAYFTAGFKVGFRLGSGSDREWKNSTRCPILRF